MFNVVEYKFNVTECMFNVVEYKFNVTECMFNVVELTFNTVEQRNQLGLGTITHSTRNNCP